MSSSKESSPSLPKKRRRSGSFTVKPPSKSILLMSETYIMPSLARSK